MATDPSRSRINVLEKTFSVLEAFSASTPELNLEGLSELTGIGKSSLQRLTHTLCELDYLRRTDKRGYYALTHRPLVLSFAYLRFDELARAASPLLGRLADQTELRADLTLLDGTDIVYAVRIPSRVETFSISPAGRRWPALASASGRAILSGLPEETVDAVFAQTELPAATTRSILDKETIRRAIGQAKVDGYAYQIGEVLEGAAAVACAINNASGLPFAAISLGTSVSELENIERRRELAATVINAANSLSSLSFVN
ncbi:IclR family transcriptional regulator [Hoeflea sp.]|uniref:IclR family transcriptional regulator n=1 Tax=Hoeflea sp. TaxID=1940281 RepID=UPI003B0218DD